MFRATESSTNWGAKDFLYLKIQGLMAYIWGDGFLKPIFEIKLMNQFTSCCWMMDDVYLFLYYKCNSYLALMF